MIVCEHCFLENQLKLEIHRIARKPNRICLSHPGTAGIPIRQIAKIMEEILKFTYVQVDWNDLLTQDLPTIIKSVLRPTHPIITDVIIEELAELGKGATKQKYHLGANFIKLRPNFFHSMLWERFRQIVSHDKRFFNSDAKAYLLDIFEGIHLQRSIDGKRPVYLVTPNQPDFRIFRARRLSDTRRLSYEEHIKFLSPPPRQLRKSGRLNPAGISVFYGAFEQTTCVAELRPPVGSLIRIGEFVITRPVCVLDTTRFSEPSKELNPFSKNYSQRIAQYMFMIDFMSVISRPVLPSDEEINYIPTQAVAEFLNGEIQFKIEGQLRSIDAIIFRSAQNPSGKNIAFLGDSATVESSAPPLNGNLRLLQGRVKTLKVTEAKFGCEETDVLLKEDSLADYLTLPAHI